MEAHEKQWDSTRRVQCSNIYWPYCCISLDRGKITDVGKFLQPKDCVLQEHKPWDKAGLKNQTLNYDLAD
jgi:hypothetical protein